jgi:exopolysaccharide biosynthesis protein
MLIGFLATLITAIIIVVVSYVAWVYWANNTYRTSEERIKGLCIARYRSNPANFTKIKAAGGETIVKTFTVTNEGKNVVTTLQQLDKIGAKVGDSVSMTFNVAYQNDPLVMLPFPPTDQMDYTTIFV